jgi:ABC-type branched-subunit amino acid transport system ATPase component
MLKLSNISMEFGALKTLNDLSIELKEKEIVSVIGPNGAGKTTLFNVITGLYKPTSGSVKLDSKEILGLSPAEINRAGIARTFQNVRLFLNMSVLENVMSATFGRTRSGIFSSALGLKRSRREEAEVREKSQELLKFFGTRLTGYRWDQPAYSLSYANRRRLEIARALATDPKVLLLDEPAAGMNPKETQEITEIVGSLRAERGLTILIIEHDMHVVEGVSDRVVALDYGVKIAEGDFDHVATHPAVVEAYLGKGSTATK